MLTGILVTTPLHQRGTRIERQEITAEAYQSKNHTLEISPEGKLIKAKKKGAIAVQSSRPKKRRVRILIWKTAYEIAAPLGKPFQNIKNLAQEIVVA